MHLRMVYLIGIQYVISLYLDEKRNIFAIFYDFYYLTLASLESIMNAIHGWLTRELFQFVYLTREINTLILLFQNLLIFILNLAL